MNTSSQIHFFLTSFLMFLPTLVVSIVGVILSVTKRKQAPDAAMWSLFGFGLALILCLTTPVGQFLIQNWVLRDGNEGRVWMFTAFGLANSVLHAAIYVFLLIAVFSGRPRASEERRHPQG